ncbi:S-methyl-5-thioribose-1-phosphate isomerase [Clostridium rectalis]|uniref:S-methyl-5-thioribose-1-phosphate isomerase n=1 Tax=Clostridium rectalis TaxID=2040295 RepID=UPI000F6331A0|nr:S-methyl-5-thioribose-1-phosphate isomerase [Clostridium rectalis]
MENVKTIQWKDDVLILLDCRKLPEKEEYIICNNYTELGEAIKTLGVRGAPAIGVAAAYGVVLSSIHCIENDLKKEECINYIKSGINYLSSTRPTAINLFWSLNRMNKRLNKIKNLSKEKIKEELLKEANLIFKEDIETNFSIGKYGNDIILDNCNILTHCNAGALATAGYGTALGVVRYAHNSGKNIHVYVDETRPLLQGARLTCWELLKEEIPATLITDNMAGYVMKLKMIDMVIFGADRITANGDVANKIGSYSLAVLAKEHNIPVYVAAPLSTIDLKLKEGKDIPIEERSKEEVRKLFGVKVAPDNIKVFNPAFDVTENNLISGIITEKGIIRPPYKKNIEEMFNKK